MFSPYGKLTAVDEYLCQLEKKRARELFQRHIAGEKCTPKDAMMCLQTVECFARRGVHTELIKSVKTSVTELERVMVHSLQK